MHLFNDLSNDTEVVHEFLHALEMRSRTREMWERLKFCEGFYDVMCDVDRQRLRAIALGSVGELLDIFANCLVDAECIFSSECAGDMPAEHDMALTNMLVLLTNVLAAGSQRLVDELWKPRENHPQGRPMMMDIIDVALRALFCNGFSITDGVGAKKEIAKEADGEVNPERIWMAGVGPGTGVDMRPGDDTVANRKLGLQLLAVLLCGDPKEPPVEPRRQRSGSFPQGVSVGEYIGVAQAWEVSVRDWRVHAHLSDPQRHLPFRAELLYSLMSVSFGYKRPSGVIRFFTPAGDSEFPHMCLQVLGLLLQDKEDAATSFAAAVKMFQPQLNQNVEFCSSNYFRQLLANITSTEEIIFLFDGLMGILDSVVDARTSYFPASSTGVAYVPETLVCLSHLAACPNFVRGISEHCDAGELIAALVAAGMTDGYPDYVSQDLLQVIMSTALVRLLVSPKVCVLTDIDFDRPIPEMVPSFNGAVADLIGLAALQSANDLFATSSSWAHSYIVEALLIALVNVSPFSEGWCVEFSLKLFGVVERCLKQLQAQPQGSQAKATWLLHLLEMLNNTVQYRYAQSKDMIYSIITHESVLRNVAELLTVERREADDIWKRAYEACHSLHCLVEHCLPLMEQLMSKNDIVTSEDAKGLLPKVIHGFLPRPHLITMRTVQDNVSAHLANEVCLVSSVLQGPLRSLWCGEGDAQKESAPTPARNTEAKRHAPGTRSHGPDTNATHVPREDIVTATAARGPATTSSVSGKAGRPRSTNGRRNRSSEDKKQESSHTPEVAGPDAASLLEQLHRAAAQGHDVSSLVKRAEAETRTSRPGQTTGDTNQRPLSSQDRPEQPNRAMAQGNDKISSVKRAEAETRKSTQGQTTGHTNERTSSSQERGGVDQKLLLEQLNRAAAEGLDVKMLVEEALTDTKKDVVSHVFEDGRRFEGRVSRGMPHGLGKMEWPNGTVYTGQYSEGRMSGEGKIEWTDGRRYVGQWLRGKIHGHGSYANAEGTWTGEWFQGKKVLPKSTVQDGTVESLISKWETGSEPVVKPSDLGRLD